MFIKVKCHSAETWCGQTKSDLDFRELPIFSYKNLFDKEEIGVGAFAVVFTAKLPGGSTWGLMLSVNRTYSIVFNVGTLKILLSTVIDDLVVKCFNYF